MNFNKDSEYSKIDWISATTTIRKKQELETTKFASTAHSSFENQKTVNEFPRDFNSVLDTINHYWIDPAKYFCPKSSSLSTIYDSFKLNVLKVVKS